ncbi:MAG: redoxin domain-containing protein [Planctomycetaceae bacterium]
MTPDQQRRLHALFTDCSQGTLTETEHEELQAVLRTGVDARRLWFLHHDLELGLKYLSHVPAELPEDGTHISMRSKRTKMSSGICSSTSAACLLRVSCFARRNQMIAAVTLLCLSAMVMIGVYGWRQSSIANHSGAKMAFNGRASDFVVESPTHGEKFTLSEQKGKLIAVHFLLKTECPFCLKLAHDYAQRVTSDSDVVHLFLKPDSADEIKVWSRNISKDRLNSPPAIYRDPDSSLAKVFGIPEDYWFHGQVMHHPALLLLDSSGRELFRYVGKNNTDRMWPDDFTAMLAMVTDHK